jgi:signal peptidase I
MSIDSGTPTPAADETSFGTPPEPVKQGMSPAAKNALLWLRDIAIAIIAVIIVMQFVKPMIVHQESMENTIHDGDYIFLLTKAYSFGHGPQRGDVIVFKSDLPSDDGTTKKNLIKRIIGLPGDTVAIHDNAVWINGKALKEPYTKDGYTAGEMAPLTVPKGEYFCMGDNRQNSTDSRVIGCIKRSAFLGKAVFRLFPLKDIGTIHAARYGK